MPILYSIIFMNRAVAVLAGVQSLEDLYETFRVSKLISLFWKSMNPVVSILLNTAEYCSSSVGSVILKEQCDKNLQEGLHNKASCSSYDNIST